MSRSSGTSPCGGHRFLDRQQSNLNTRATAHRTGERGNGYGPRIGTAYVHTVIDDHSRVAYASACCTGRPPGSPRGASLWNRCSQTMGLATAPTPGGMPAPISASNPSDPGPTGPRPMGKSNASTAPWPMAGPTPGSTPPRHSAIKSYQTGCTSIITIEPTPPSEVSHRSPTDQAPWTSQLILTGIADPGSFGEQQCLTTIEKVGTASGYVDVSCAAAEHRQSCP